MNENPQLLAYLDKHMGSHQGRWPEFQWHCPQCLNRRGSESNEPKLGINIAKGKGGCFRCEYGFRTLKKLLQDLNKGKLGTEELAMLSGGDGAPAPREGVSLYASTLATLYGRRPVESPLKPLTLPKEFLPLSHKNLPRMAYHGLKYAMHTRGITAKEIADFNLGFCLSGEYSHRIIFPVTYRGKVVYFSNRAVDPENIPKTKNPKNRDGFITRDHVLFNFDACVGAKRAAMAEGPVSVIKSSRHIPTFGLLGKRMSDHQFKLLLELVQSGLEEIIIAVDADAIPDKIHDRILGSVPSVKFLPIQAGDPDDNDGVMDALLQDARPLRLSDRVARRMTGASWGRRIFSGVGKETKHQIFR